MEISRKLHNLERQDTFTAKPDKIDHKKVPSDLQSYEITRCNKLVLTEFKRNQEVTSGIEA